MDYNDHKIDTFRLIMVLLVVVIAFCSVGFYFSLQGNIIAKNKSNQICAEKGMEVFDIEVVNTLANPNIVTWKLTCYNLETQDLYFYKEKIKF